MYGLNKTMNCLDIANTENRDDSISLLDIDDDSLLDIKTCCESSEAEQSFINKYRPLIEVLCEFNKCRIYGLKRALRKRKMENLEFLTQRHVSIMTTYETKYVGRICIDPHGFTSKGARHTMALGKHRSKTSVESYFMVKRKITLKYGFLPCIIVRLGNISRYYPLEVLEILVP